MKKTAVLAMLVLAGCATQAPLDPAIVQAANAPLTCQDKAQCDLYWSRAQALLERAGPFRIRIANDTIIDTFGPSYDTQADLLAYSLTKMPNPDGSATIHIDATCGAPSLCTRTAIQALAMIKGFIRTGQ